MDNQNLGCMFKFIGGCDDGEAKKLNEKLNGKLDEVQRTMDREFTKLKEITEANGHKLDVLFLMQLTVINNQGEIMDVMKSNKEDLEKLLNEQLKESFDLNDQQLEKLKANGISLEKLLSMSKKEVEFIWDITYFTRKICLLSVPEF